MELDREAIERTIKILMDKMKFKLGLKFRSEDYVVMLVDSLPNDVFITQGEQVVIKIQSDRLVEVFSNKKEGYKFKRLLEHCLLAIPKMQSTLSKPAIADVLEYVSEAQKFRKLSQKQFDAKYPLQPFERDVHYRYEYRCEAIHMRTGIVVRDYGESKEHARNKARKRILTLLQDPEIYKKENDEFLYLEPHEDAIRDIIGDAKVLNRDEIETLIARLREEYLK